MDGRTKPPTHGFAIDGTFVIVGSGDTISLSLGIHWVTGNGSNKRDDSERTEARNCRCQLHTGLVVLIALVRIKPGPDKATPDCDDTTFKELNVVTNFGSQRLWFTDRKSYINITIFF